MSRSVVAAIVSPSKRIIKAKVVSNKVLVIIPSIHVKAIKTIQPQALRLSAAPSTMVFSVCSI